MANREFLQLAQDFDPTKHSIGGWMISEKLDGMRAFWDGGITTGVPAAKVPWANTAKDHIRKNEVISTGLWSRYGKVIHAPEEWLMQLPTIPCDGELYAGRGKFQTVTSIVKDEVGDVKNWLEQIVYQVFDTVSYLSAFEDGRIYNPNFQKVFSFWEEWSKQTRDTYSGIDMSPWYNTHFSFRTSQALLEKYAQENDNFQIHSQTELPYPQDEAVETINENLDRITSEGGEGLMLRRLESVWEPKRTKNLLKVKKLLDSEAEVVGYTTGKRTDKGSKLLGLMGALIVEWQGKCFELSGFTDEERELHSPGNDNTIVQPWACEHPGEKCPKWIEAKSFPIGTVVTFKYRELTNDGIPKEARYYRKHST